MSLSTTISILFIVLFYSHNVAGKQKEIRIDLIETNMSRSVWEYELIELWIQSAVTEWYFNNIKLAELDPYNEWIVYKIPTLTFNATDGSDSTSLNLIGVNQSYTGNYSAETIRTISLTVHKIDLNGANFSLEKSGSVCSAYLNLDESITPPPPNFVRLINSSELTLANPSSTEKKFQIINGSLDLNGNVQNISIDVEYQFNSTNYSIGQVTQALAENVIQRPSITTERNSTSCSIRIIHDSSIPCVRKIQYCLDYNGTERNCTNSTVTNEHREPYPAGTSSVNLSIEYDFIYGHQRFEQSVELCRDEPPPSDSKSLPGWAIALIVVGSVLFLLIIAAIIGYCIWRKRSPSKPASDIPMARRPSNTRKKTGKVIPDTKRRLSDDSFPSMRESREKRRELPPLGRAVPASDPYPLLANPRPRYQLAPATNDDTRDSQWMDQRRPPRSLVDYPQSDDPDSFEIISHFSPYDGRRGEPRTKRTPPSPPLEEISQRQDNGSSVGSDRMVSAVL